LRAREKEEAQNGREEKRDDVHGGQEEELERLRLMGELEMEFKVKSRGRCMRAIRK
jgi:type II secretory pathway predicted ATPase ExeA